MSDLTEEWTAEQERQLIVETARGLANHYRNADPDKCDRDMIEAAVVALDQFADNIEQCNHIKRRDAMKGGAK